MWVACMMRNHRTKYVMVWRCSQLGACCAGSFIENDNGVYQDDFGEEEDWDVAEDTGGDDVEDADEHPKKKRKGDAKGQCALVVLRCNCCDT